jgi:tripartite-type tricarboxylate transporter receptor subunit TctC
MTMKTQTASMLRLALRLFILLGSSLAAVAPAAAQDAPFAGKTLSMLVSSGAGGGTDATARLVAPFLTKYLPGNPAVVVRNMPGADGIVALNYFVQQAEHDGLTLIAGDGPSIDPIRYRSPQSHYDPGRFNYIGGIGRGGSMVVIRGEAAARLHDKTASPVSMGIASSVPRSGQLIAAWGIGFLDWNAKWIVGYRSTSALMLALQQGEIDMTATSNLFSLKDAMASGKVKAEIQSGGLQHGKTVPRPEFANVPLLDDKIADKLKDPVAKQAFAYWRAVLMVDKFLALPPDTPKPMVAAYRKAYHAMIEDPDFNERGRRMSEVFQPMTDDDVTELVGHVVGTPPAAVDYLADMLRKQGISGR